MSSTLNHGPGGVQGMNFAYANRITLALHMDSTLTNYPWGIRDMYTE